MFFTSRMSYVELIVLEKDFSLAIDLLGGSGWFEIRKRELNRQDNLKRVNEDFNSIERKINDIELFFNIDKTADNGRLKDLSLIKEYFNNLHDLINSKMINYDELIQSRDELKRTLIEISMLKNLRLTKNDFDSFEHVFGIIGYLKPEDIDIVKREMSDRVIISNLGDNLCIIFTSKKGRWSLETELKKVAFKEVKLSGEENLFPAQIVEKMENDLSKIEKEINDIENYKKELFTKEESNIVENIKSLNLLKVYDGISVNLNHSESITLIEGFIIKKRIKKFVAELRNILGDNFSFVSFEPDEIDDVKNGNIKVPVYLENPFFLKPFEALILNYGSLTYKSIDPTFLVALTFLLFFGMMYGDMGQGIVIFIVGFFLTKQKKYHDLGFVISSIGIASFIFGFFYGSFFCFEHDYLEAFLLPIDKFLFGIDRPYLIDLSPENSMNIFIFTVALGLFIGLLGISVNIINYIIKGKIKRILFAHNGIAGFLLFLSLVIILLRFVILNKSSGYLPVIIIIISLTLIFLNEPLTNLILGSKKIIHSAFGLWFFSAVVELFEIILNTISGNLSFIRIGAFAFAHSILSHTTIMLVNMVGGIYTGGGIIILLVGNIIIIVLEAMIVGIQSIRLEYYEFFSKFFTEQGRMFNPFKIEKKIGGI